MKRFLTICSLLLCAVFLFTACQKEEKKSEKHTHEEVTEEVITEASAAEEFIGCWEDFDSYNWICIYEDGTYEIYSENGEVYGPAPYDFDGEQLVLSDTGTTLVMAESGNLESSTGEVLFKSHLPEPEETEEEPEYTVDEELQHKYELSQAFSGSWRCDELDGWIIIEPYNDGTYRTYSSDGVEIEWNVYEIEGEELRLAGYDVTLSLMEDGQILTSDGNILYRAPIDQSEVRNELLEGDWEYSEGDYMITFDGIDQFTLSGPGLVISGKYQYNDTGVHLYNYGEEIDFGDIDNAGYLTLNGMEGGFFYPPEGR